MSFSLCRYIFFIQEKGITYISMENPGGQTKGMEQQPKVRTFLVLLGTVETKGSTVGYHCMLGKTS